MKRSWLLVLILLLLPVVFAQQSVNSPSGSGSVTNSEQLYEKFVVKEHFLTRNEIKAYIDEQGVVFEVMVNGVVANSFAEFDKMLSAKINKFIMKLIVGIFGVMVFSGSFWFFISYRLNQKKEKIMSLQNEIVSKKNDSEASEKEPVTDTKKEEKPVKEPVSKPKKDDSLKIEVKTEESVVPEEKTEKEVVSEKKVIDELDVPKPNDKLVEEEDDLFSKFVQDLMGAKTKKEVKQIKKKYKKDLREQYNKIASF